MQGRVEAQLIVEIGPQIQGELGPGSVGQFAKFEIRHGVAP
jgi:hypothetical protein